ncbi:S41 family peptidase [Winogradskyella sp. 3972H.M.0a.05]|uniref:S41 family peptidase n=1 Tax=Winogradskyella sp. 3972H.M.0a.05 TaxID=2950277 RepID=UPI003399EFDA
MKTYKAIILLCLSAFIITACFNDDIDDNIQFSDLEVKDFIWKALNVVYLYKSEIDDLADDRFSSDEEYTNYLEGFATPNDLFESLIFERETIDRFSILVPDYIALQQALQGTSISNGLRFFAFENPSNSAEAILVVSMVAKGSPGESAGIQRGDYFNQIDGVTLTANNINDLLASDSYTLHFADYDDNGTPEVTDDDFTTNGNTVALTKTTFTENPVNTTNIIDLNGENVGYIMYRGFRANFVNELNAAFGEFAANNVQHLVLDLRYNGGGRVDVAAALGSMITGQHTGEIFTKLFYNETLQELNSNFLFVNDFNSLNLDKVYILTTGQTASASELMINSLRPYLSDGVVQIGTTTEGKPQFSQTIYDSPTLTSEMDANPNHTYAMQPLLGNSSNVNDELVPNTGIPANITIQENVLNLGSFGDVNEPLLAAALADIEGIGRFGEFESPTRVISKHGAVPFEQEMFVAPTTN